MLMLVYNKLIKSAILKTKIISFNVEFFSTGVKSQKKVKDQKTKKKEIKKNQNQNVIITRKLVRKGRSLTKYNNYRYRFKRPFQDVSNRELVENQLNLLKDRKERKRLRVPYFLVLKPTKSNLFAYVYYLGLNLKKKNRRGKFVGASLGTVGYEGAKKKGDIAIRHLGMYIGQKLKDKKILKINVIVRRRLGRKSREFFKGLRIHRIRIKRRYLIPKRIHNGCRGKRRKRL